MSECLAENVRVLLGSFQLQVERLPYRPGLHLLRGVNGSGKSTLLRTLVGLVELSEGRVERKKRMGFVPQNYRAILSSWATVRKNLSWLNDVEIDEFLKYGRRLDLPESLLERRPFQLSGGQAQKVCVLREALLQLDCLILDEPFSSVDQASIESVCEVLADLEARHPMVIVASHIDPPIDRFAGISVFEHELVFSSANTAQLVLDS